MILMLTETQLKALDRLEQFNENQKQYFAYRKNAYGTVKHLVEIIRSGGL